jgi:16S rRNA (cytosine1402-N4)-methyltransferase
MIDAYHVPVLRDRTIELLITDLNGIYVDATFGAGGHTRALLQSLSKEAKVFGFDQDDDAAANVGGDSRFQLCQYNFRFIKKVLRLNGVSQVDGIMADLGVSSHQFDKEERGFSYRGEAMLDMRMNQKSELTAKTVLATYRESELLNIFSVYGEVRNARQLTRQILDCRAKRPLETTQDLLNAINPVMKGDKFKYLAQVFQALRIEVNDELNALKDLLEQGFELLKPGGRMVVLTYHSLEDRMVKNFFKYGNIDGEIVSDFYGNIKRPFEIITKKPIVPDMKEQKTNPRSQSAKLRAGAKV